AIIKQSDVKKEVKKQEAKQTVKTTDWKQNKDGIWYKTEHASFTVTASEGIITRYKGPWTGHPQAGVLQKGQTIKYDEVQKFDGHVWVSWETFEGETVYMPVRTWDAKTGKVGKLWGEIK
ncbi:SH3 domain-containing protein, partial [Staphylococcus pseudintermedius]|nr:SH3 domain-containing protein [Staphylococcus pseudintermedius]